MFVQGLWRVPKLVLDSVEVGNNSGLRLRKRWAGFSLAFCVVCAQSGHVGALVYFVGCTQEGLRECFCAHITGRAVSEAAVGWIIYFFGVGCALCVCLGIRTLSPMFFEAHVTCVPRMQGG
jgi:hypothetical protein